MKFIYFHSFNMDQSLYLHFSSLLNETIAKRKLKEGSKNSIDDEYNKLEQVPPAPGDPGMQHDVMVEKGIKVRIIVGFEWHNLRYQFHFSVFIEIINLIVGLCKKAEKNEIKNRYCNLFPFDRNLVSLEKEEDYINASWIELPKGKIITEEM